MKQGTSSGAGQYSHPTTNNGTLSYGGRVITQAISSQNAHFIVNQASHNRNGVSGGEPANVFSGSTLTTTSGNKMSMVADANGSQSAK